MTPQTADLTDLVNEVAALRGGDLPAVLRPETPVLSDAATSDAARGLYWVGLIGGKEVGKSALVNALAGQEITRVTDTGEGTSLAVAYVHADAAGEVLRTLESAAPGRYQIIPHRIDALRRQVLLDLPDIDSRHTAHVELTRSLLQHLLYPLWITSEEKYADKSSHDMLKQVALGNDEANFVFVLNKVDLRTPREAAEIAADYADRLAASLGIAPPRVYAISALNPSLHDLPELRRTLNVGRSVEEVAAAAQKASSRKDQSLAVWLRDQRLPAAADRAARIYDDCSRQLIADLVTPLLEESVPAIASDPAVAMRLSEEAFSRRVERWPIVRVVHALLGPPMALATSLLRRGSSVAGSESDAIAQHLRLDGRSLDHRLGGLFARLRRQYPELADHYPGAAARLWRKEPAADAVATLEHSLTRTLAGQRSAALDRLGRPGGAAAAAARWALTVGALIWFPIVQPLVHLLLQTGWTAAAHDLLLLAVRVFSAEYLLSSAAFLAIYFVVLWLWLRWDTQHKVRRLLARGDGPAGAGLADQTAVWAEGLLAPLTAHRDRLRSLADRAEQATAKLLPAPASK